MKQSAVPSGKRWRQNASTSKTTSFFAYLLKFRNMYRFYLLYCLFLLPWQSYSFAQTTGFAKKECHNPSAQYNQTNSLPQQEFYKEGKRRPCMAILSPFRAHRQTRYSPTSGLHIKRKARDYTMDLQRTSQKRFAAL